MSNMSHPEAASFPRALVADDSAVSRRIAQRTLESLGYTVTVVKDGQHAAELAGEHRFDVVLMDIDMPIMDGLSATRLIRSRELPRGEHVPIIAVTADHTAAECFAAGIDLFLPKEQLPQQLSRMLSRLGGDEAA